MLEASVPYWITHIDVLTIGVTERTMLTLVYSYISRTWMSCYCTQVMLRDIWSDPEIIVFFAGQIFDVINMILGEGEIIKKKDKRGAVRERTRSGSWKWYIGEKRNLKRARTFKLVNKSDTRIYSSAECFTSYILTFITGVEWTQWKWRRCLFIKVMKY